MIYKSYTINVERKYSTKYCEYLFYGHIKELNFDTEDCDTRRQAIARAKTLIDKRLATYYVDKGWCY